MSIDHFPNTNLTGSNLAGMKTFYLLISLASLLLGDGGDEVTKAALYLSGADSEEAVTEEFQERLEYFLDRPVGINTSSRSRLLSSGLFSRFQVAAIEDYRSRHGDILSLTELSFIEGFPKEAVDALGPFLSFEPSLSGGDSLRIRQTILGRATLKGWKGKYRISYGDALSGGLSVKGGWAPGEFSYTSNAVWAHRKGKVIIGDYNAKFGQGLLLWTGFRLTGYPAPKAFRLNGSGISPLSGATPSLRGIAADYSRGRWVFTGMGGKGVSGASAGYFFRNGEVSVQGITGRNRGVSASGGWTLRGGADLFGEAGFNGEWAGTGGALIPLTSRIGIAAVARALPSGFTGKKNGEYGVAAGGWAHSEGYINSQRIWEVSATVDVAALPVPEKDIGRKQIKTYVTGAWRFGKGWCVSGRYYGRYRNYGQGRTDVRAEIGWDGDVFIAKSRLNAVTVDSKAGLLAYAEGGAKGEKGWAYIRATLFKTPSYAERIYCYERDAPGNFNVPAYYGEGVSLSATGALKMKFEKGRKAYLYLRGCVTRKKPQDCSYGLYVQFNLTI